MHGISRDAWNRYTASGSWYYEIEDAGYKYNMTDIAAALGLVQLERARGAARATQIPRGGIFGRPSGHRQPPISLEPPEDATDGSHAWHLYIVRLELDRLGLDRAAVIEGTPRGRRWERASISSRSTCIRTTGDGGAPGPSDHPVATAEYERVISLPIWPGMRDADVDRVVDAMASILDGARR